MKPVFFYTVFVVLSFFTTPFLSGMQHQDLDHAERHPKKTDVTLEDKKEEEKDCAVCLEPMLKNEIISIVTCTHQFHTICIDQWLINNSTCPLCRADIKKKSSLFCQFCKKINETFDVVCCCSMMATLFLVFVGR